MPTIDFGGTVGAGPPSILSANFASRGYSNGANASATFYVNSGGFAIVGAASPILDLAYISSGASADLQSGVEPTVFSDVHAMVHSEQACHQLSDADNPLGDALGRKQG